MTRFREGLASALLMVNGYSKLDSRVFDFTVDCYSYSKINININQHGIWNYFKYVRTFSVSDSAVFPPTPTHTTYYRVLWTVVIKKSRENYVFFDFDFSSVPIPSLQCSLQYLPHTYCIIYSN